MNVKEMFDSVALSLIAFLESHEGVKNVQLFETKPASITQIENWEKTNKTPMPSELRSFLLYSNGFLLKWKISLSDDKELQMGYMSVLSIEKIVEVKKREEEGESAHPFHSAYELSSSTSHCSGRVCLVFKDNPMTSSSEIWYQDLGLNWWFVSKTFVEYFRLMILHLGLPNWQMIFTDSGLPSTTKQWIRFLSPQRLVIDLSRTCLNTETPLRLPEESMSELFRGQNLSRVKELQTRNKKKKKKVNQKKAKLDLKKLDAMAAKTKKKEKSLQADQIKR